MPTDQVHFLTEAAASRVVVRFVLVASGGAFVLLAAIAWISLANLAADGWRVEGAGNAVAAVFGTASVLLLLGFVIVVPLVVTRARASVTPPVHVWATRSGIRVGESLVVPWNDVVAWRAVTLPQRQASGGVVVVRLGDPRRCDQVAAVLPGVREGDEIVLGSLSAADMARWTTLAAMTPEADRS